MIGYEHCHPWCMNPARDEAVRAAEDGRSGPLPTLEESISGVTNRRPVEPGGGGNVTGALRTERVTLEITTFIGCIPKKWPWRDIMGGMAWIHPEESVRVVEETHFDDVAQVAMERDAAIRERDNLRAERITQALTADRFAAAVQEADRLRARVAELESAPAASGAAGTGWLTGDERLAVSGATLILDQHGPTNIGRTLNDLLARSSPPEVVHPECVFDEFSGCSAVHAWNICAANFRKALAAAGVKVKEVRRDPS